MVNMKHKCWPLGWKCIDLSRNRNKCVRVSRDLCTQLLWTTNWECNFRIEVGLVCHSMAVYSYRHRVPCCVFWYSLAANHMLITKWRSFWSDFYVHFLRDAGWRGSVQITEAKQSGRRPGAWLCCLCLCLCLSQ